MQSLHYAGWVEQLRPEDVAAIYERFAPGKSLAQDSQQRFGMELDEETLNESHQVVIVAAKLDASTERILSYLSKRGLPINVLYFQVFRHGDEHFLSRAWLLDPVQVQANTTGGAASNSESWNGEFYANSGVGENRSWDDALQFGFISAGGGTWYTGTLQLLNPGDRVWVKAPGHGFVGVGRVTGAAQPAVDFKVQTSNGEVSVLDVAKGGKYHRAESEENCEYFVPVKWLQTVSLDAAIHEVGLFGHQHSVCKPRTPKWRNAVERLKLKYPEYDAAF